MSFLHTHSNGCLTSELDLFSLPLTQTSIESSKLIYYKSVNSTSDDSPIRFVIPGNRKISRFTHTMLSLRVDPSDVSARGTTGTSSGSISSESSVGP